VNSRARRFASARLRSVTWARAAANGVVTNPQSATTRWVGDSDDGDSDDGDSDDGDDSDNDVGAPIIQLHVTAAHHVCPLRSGHGGSARYVYVYDDTHGESSRTDRVIETTR
jgi:hypothetical protein